MLQWDGNVNEKKRNMLIGVNWVALSTIELPLSAWGGGTIAFVRVCARKGGVPLLLNVWTPNKVADSRSHSKWVALSAWGGYHSVRTRACAKGGGVPLLLNVWTPIRYQITGVILSVILLDVGCIFTWQRYIWENSVFWVEDYSWCIFLRSVVVIAMTLNDKGGVWTVICYR